MENINPENINQANKDLFNNIAGQYKTLFPEEFNWHTNNLIRGYVRKISDFFKGQDIKVLDVGAGTGRITLEFLKLGIPVTALDISAEMLSILDERAKKLKNYHLLTKHAMPLDEFLENSKEEYSVICFGAILHHISNYEELFIKSLNLFEEKAACLIVGEPLSIENMKVKGKLQLFFSYASECLVALNFMIKFGGKWSEKLKERRLMLSDKLVHKRFWDGNFYDDFFTYLLTKNDFKIDVFKKRGDCSTGFMTWFVDLFNICYVEFDLLALRNK